MKFEVVRLSEAIGMLDFKRGRYTSEENDVDLNKYRFVTVPRSFGNVESIEVHYAYSKNDKNQQ